MEVTTKAALAKSLGVSRSTLYYKPKIPLKDLSLKADIEEVWINFPEYGHKRLSIHLKVNKKRIIRVMHLFKMKPPKRRVASPAKPDDLNKPTAPFPNLIKNFCPIRPGVVWVADFTYISYRGRFIYLATVMDLYTREIIGWNILSVHTVTLIRGALNDALRRTGQIPIYFHSDQGSEYEALEHLRSLKALGINISMSKKGSPWENGCQESYYNNFKLELGDSNRFETLGELISQIHFLINRYNHLRIHTTLKCSPICFKEKFYQKTALKSTYSVS